jgi:uncharacterized membrane protein YbhN (UPF0104 family)
MTRWFREHWVVVVGVIALIALVIVVHPAQVARALTRADPLMLALMLPTVLVLYLVHGVAWWVALRGAGIKVSLWRAIAITYMSQTFTYLPGGDLWRVPLVETGARGRVEVGAVTASVVFDDLVYFVVLTLAMVPAALQAPLLFTGVGATLLPQAVIFAILLWPWLYHALASVVTRLPLVRRFEAPVQSLGPSFRHLMRPRTLIPVVLLDVLASLLAIALFTLALRGVRADNVSLGRIAFTYSLGQVGSSLTVLPASLGAYEGLMTGLIATQGVAAAVAALAALLYRGFNDILMALIGFAMAVVLRRVEPRRDPPERAHVSSTGSG